MTKEEIGFILKKLRLSCNMTQKEIAEKIGRTQQIIGHWETGYAQPDANTLFTLCELYNTTVDEAFGFVRTKQGISTNEYELVEKYRNLDLQGQETVSYILDRETERVKQLSQQNKRIWELESQTTPTRIIAYYQRLASAGSGDYLFDDIPTEFIKVKDTPLASQADFVIGVNGNSMEPDYSDGEKVFVKKTAELNIGEVGIFVQGNECYIKELGERYLISRNKSCSDVIPVSEVYLVGKVIGKVEE